MNKYIIIAVVLVLLVGGFFLLRENATGNVTGNSIKGDNQPVKEFVIQSYTEIIDGKYYPQFSQKEIEVSKGDLVRIRITNTKGTHDFKIDEFNVYTETPLNQEMTVEFTADKAGEFEYYCTKTGHRQNGHWGKLIVI